MSEDLRIYKYPLVITDRQFIEMPANSRLLSVVAKAHIDTHYEKRMVTEGDVIFLYARVDVNDEQRVRREIRIYGTGNPKGFQDGDEIYERFLGTVQTGEGFYVWHVFEAQDATELPF